MSDTPSFSKMPNFAKAALSFLVGTALCPDCDALLTADVMNIQEGVALCPECGRLSRLSELNTSGRSVHELLTNPPAGCFVESDGQRAKVTASLRTWAGFLFATAFALFWNGIVSVFILIAIAGLFTNLVGPLPEWFPAPGMKNGKPEMNGGPMGLGETLFLCIFLTPFIVVGTIMATTALMNLCGSVDVVLDEFGSYVSTGVGFLRWKKRFDPREAVRVELCNSFWQSKHQYSKAIELTCDRPVRFGSMLQPDRMIWLRAVLRQMLNPQRDDRRPNDPLPLTWLSRKTN